MNNNALYTHKARRKSMRGKDRESKARIVAFSLVMCTNNDVLCFIEQQNWIHLVWYDLFLAHEWIRNRSTTKIMYAHRTKYYVTFIHSVVLFINWFLRLINEFQCRVFFRFSHSLSAQQKMTIHRKYDSVHINCIKYFIDDGDTTNDVMMAIVERLVSYLYILAAHWLFIVSMAHYTV